MGRTGIGNRLTNTRIDACIYIYIDMCVDVYIYIYIYIYGSPPPQGLPREGGNVSLPSVGLNTLKDMLRKHCKFQCFMHTLLVVF